MEYDVDKAYGLSKKYTARGVANATATIVRRPVHKSISALLTTTG